MKGTVVRILVNSLNAADLQAALDAAKQDAERVRKEFVASLPPDSPAYDGGVDHPIRQRGPTDFRVLGGA